MDALCKKVQNSKVKRPVTRLQIQAFWTVSFLIFKTIHLTEVDYCIMMYGYARVSSKKQLHGNSLEEQTATLTANGATSITAEQFTGKTTSRPKLQALIDSLQAGDTLMVTKLDRLARNVTEGIE